jgi:hypothetical protein
MLSRQITPPPVSEPRRLPLPPENSGSGRRPLIDDRLQHVNFAHWTEVAISDAVAADIISLYLELDYPVMPLFNADLFLDDLVNQRTDFCCRFLISALLCFGCVSRVTQH